MPGDSGQEHDREVVMLTLISPGTPTLRISADVASQGYAAERQSDEQARRAWISGTRLPTPSGTIRPQLAPAGANQK